MEAVATQDETQDWHSILYVFLVVPCLMELEVPAPVGHVKPHLNRLLWLWGVAGLPFAGASQPPCLLVLSLCLLFRLP